MDRETTSISTWKIDVVPRPVIRRPKTMFRWTLLIKIKSDLAKLGCFFDRVKSGRVGVVQRFFGRQRQPSFA